MITSEGPHPSENSRQNCPPLLVLNLILPRYRTFIQHWESSKQHPNLTARTEGTLETAASVGKDACTPRFLSWVP